MICSIARIRLIHKGIPEMRLTKLKTLFVAAFVAGAGGTAAKGLAALPAEVAPEEEVVAIGEATFWLGGDEVDVASGESVFWLGPDEIVVSTDEREFALSAFRDLPANPTVDDVRLAIEASGAKDKNRILALICGASDPVAAYQAFNAWAQGVGDVAVVNSAYAGDSYAFGVDELFENAPKVQISDIAVGTGEPGAMAVAVTVKDGDSPKRVKSANVALMFEATTDVANWTEGRIEANVTDRTKDLATPVKFTVTPGDGKAEKAFLRIRE